MDEQKTRQIVQQEIQKHASDARFTLNSIPRHIHNDIDSPYVFQPILNYAGIVVWNGVTVIGATLPRGWSVSYVSTGKYIVTHGLPASAIYVVNAIANQSTNMLVAAVVTYFVGSFSITWGDTTPAFYDTSFSFLLTVINNRSTQLPVYIT